MTDQRVVSLLPSATETLCALGVEPVGVTHECDYPPEVTELPTVVHSRIDTDGDSTAVDDAVQAADDGVYRLDRERLRELDPDVVVTQGICDVCAVDETVARETIADLGLDAEFVATHPHTLTDVFDSIERLGEVLGRSERATQLRAELERRVAAVRETATAAVEATGRPRVAVLDWLDPVMVAGHWVPELVEIAGGEPVLADVGERSGPVRFDSLVAADPAVVVAAPCGFAVPRTLADADALVDRDGYDDLPAAPDRTYVVDGNHYLNRPGPRLVESLQHLAAAIHPTRFDPPGTGLCRLDAAAGAATTVATGERRAVPAVGDSDSTATAVTDAESVEPSRAPESE